MRCRRVENHLLFHVLKFVFIVIVRCCEFPKINVWEGFQTREPDVLGYYSFQSNIPEIDVISKSDNPINFIYASENINVLEISTKIEISFGEGYEIHSKIKFQNGTGFGVFFSKIIRNEPCCAKIEIAIGTPRPNNNISKFKISYLSNVSINDMAGSNNEQIGATMNQLMALEFCVNYGSLLYIKVDHKERVFSAKCRDIGSLEPNLRLQTIVGPIDLNANLQNGVLPLDCVTYLDKGSFCENCIKFENFTFQPTIVNCFDGVYKHYLFFPLDLIYGATTTAELIIYNSWSDANMKRMMWISLPSQINMKDDVIIRCIFSNQMFILETNLTMQFQLIDDIDEEWLDVSPFDISFFTNADQYNNLMDEYRIKFRKFFKMKRIKCRGRLWNTTEIVQVVKPLTYQYILPKFEKTKEIIQYSGPVDLSINCSAASDLIVNYSWKFPVSNDLKPKVSKTWNGSSVHLPAIDDRFIGSYFCIATNDVGDSVKEFKVTRAGDSFIPQPNYNNEFVLLWIILIILVFFLLLGMGIYYLRYIGMKWKRLQKYYSQTSEVNDFRLTSTLTDSKTIEKQEVDLWRTKQLQLFKCTEALGQGYFANVYKGVHLQTKDEYAIKVVSLFKSLRTSHGDLDHVLREIRNMEAITHPNVIRMFSCWIENEKGEMELENIFNGLSSTHDSFLYIQMELCDFTLQHWLEQNPSIEDRIYDIPKLFKDCISGLNALHNNGIIHRDIKPNNILCNISSTSAVPLIWKIGDLGLSISISNSEINVPLSAKGCADYRSPEMAYPVPANNKEKKYDCKTDIFSLGLVFLEVIRPFENKLYKYDAFEKLRRNIHGQSVKDLFPPLPEESISTVEMIDDMLAVNPISRSILNN